MNTLTDKPLEVKILWTKLQRILSNLTGQPITIHATTAMSNSIISAVDITEKGSVIVINLHHVKSLDTLFDALAHEVTHILGMSAKHDIQFADKMLEIRRMIEKEYGE